MAARNPHVLVVEDDAAMGSLLVRELSRRGFAMRHVTRAAEALTLIETEDFDAIVSDVRLGGMTGLELCERIASRRPEVPIVIVTAFGDLDTAIAAIRAGAHDFLPKPFEIAELVHRIGRASELRSLRAEVRRLRVGVGIEARFEEMIGDSPAMRRVFGWIDRVASSDAPVLVRGETGTGKELVARALHARGPRASGPFVAIRCASVPEHLLEGELFGQAKDASADGRGARAGVFVEASGGTLFLDEVAELPLPLQATLLRAIQEKRVRPVGGDHEVPFEARIVGATHRDLDSRVESGDFRGDLHERLQVLSIALPPLRERGSDVLLLANEWLRKIASRTGRNVKGIAPEAARKLVEYGWPGNVRELVNAMERAVALAEYDELTVADLPEKIQRFAPSHVLVAGVDPSELVPLDEVEKRYVLRVLEAVGGNRTRAAEILRVDRKTLYSKLKSYGVRPGDVPQP